MKFSQKNILNLVILNFIIAVIVGYISYEKISSIKIGKHVNNASILKNRLLRIDIEKNKSSNFATYKDFSVRANLKRLNYIIGTYSNLEITPLSSSKKGWRYGIVGDLGTVLLFSNRLVQDPNINIQYRLEKIKVLNDRAVLQILLIGV